MKRLKGEQAFNDFYGEIYGERWPQLKAALFGQKKYVAYYNPFVDQEKKGTQLAPHLFQAENWDTPELIDKLKNYYLLDYASTLPIAALEIAQEDKVVDLCAAPGGKSLMIMGERPESLTCNDLSHERLQRLKKIMQDYLPAKMKERIQYTKRDATKWGTYEKKVFDKTLLDAPCSSERHFLEKGELMKDWSEGRTKRLAKLQFALLAAAIDITKAGGRVVYSTCSISPYENDDVIKKALKKREGQFKIAKMELPIGEATEYGVQILPDKGGHGPFYLSVMDII